MKQSIARGRQRPDSQVVSDLCWVYSRACPMRNPSTAFEPEVWRRMVEALAARPSYDSMLSAAACFFEVRPQQAADELSCLFYSGPNSSLRDRLVANVFHTDELLEFTVRMNRLCRVLEWGEDRLEGLA